MVSIVRIPLPQLERPPGKEVGSVFSVLGRVDSGMLLVLGTIVGVSMDEREDREDVEGEDMAGEDMDMEVVIINLTESSGGINCV